MIVLHNASVEKNLRIAKKRGETFSHKFATKFHFKGPYDGCGKRLKKFIFDSELENNRARGAFTCCLRYRDKFNTKNKNPVWIELEEKWDAKLIDKITFKDDRISISFVTGSFSECEKLPSTTVMKTLFAHTELKSLKTLILLLVH